MYARAVRVPEQRVQDDKKGPRIADWAEDDSRYLTAPGRRLPTPYITWRIGARKATAGGRRTGWPDFAPPT